MVKTVIDASALLALLNREPGADIVEQALPGGVMSAVNVTEVVAKLSEFGIPDKAIHQAIKPLGLEVIPFSEEQAYHAGLLRTTTKNIGVSLGDRACLSLAKMQELTVLTADRAWVSLSIGVTIKVIR